VRPYRQWNFAIKGGKFADRNNIDWVKEQEVLCITGYLTFSVVF
jgi:hypothetical protein